MSAQTTGFVWKYLQILMVYHHFPIIKFDHLRYPLCQLNPFFSVDFHLISQLQRFVGQSWAASKSTQILTVAKATFVGFLGESWVIFPVSLLVTFDKVLRQEEVILYFRCCGK